MNIKCKSFLIFLFIFTFVHLLFNFRLWQDLIISSSNEVHVSDGTITEFLTETGYQKIKSKQNPFSHTNKVFYPFGINYSMNDPGISNSFLFIFIRPFLNTHQSTLLIVLSNIFLAGIFMYWLLLKFSKSTYASGLFAMVYAFMPFISHRLLGHFTYTPIYLFPLLGLVSWNFLHTNSIRVKLWLSLFFGALLSFSLYSNFYYFIMICMSIGFFLFWHALKNFKNFNKFIFANYKYFILASIIFILTLYPWAIEVKNYFLFEGRSSSTSLSSAIHYSADVLGFIIPNNYNLIYDRLFSFLVSVVPQAQAVYSFYSHSWERLVYPGLILIFSYIFILFNYRRLRKNENWSNLLPFLIASLIFGIFLLGPFLKVAGKWSLNLDGVAVVFPLPFLIFNYLPVLESLRVPTRFIAIVIFYASIVGAYLVASILKNKSQKNKTIFIVSAFAIFFVDQFYILPEKISNPIPTALYQELKNDSSNYRILEIPYMVRDGFNYFGFVHALAPMQGIPIHQHSIMGGYLARVSPEVFSYYKNLNFLGYVASVTDKGNYNPYYQQPEEPVVFPYPYDHQTVRDELDFFGIKYLILKKNEQYTSAINDVLFSMTLETVMQNNDYWLFRREVDWEKDYSTIDFSKEIDPYYLGRGLDVADDSYLMTDGKAIVFLRTNKLLSNRLIIEASAQNNTSIEVYVNHQLQGQIELNNQTKSFDFDIRIADSHESIHVMLRIVDQKVSDPKVRFHEISIK
jgi:hypothetical protein